MSEWNMRHRMQSATRFLVCLVVAVVCGAVVSGCRKSDLEEACPLPPVVDGFITIKTEVGGMTLRLPWFADVGQRRDEQGVCKSHFVAIDYLWYQGTLISEAKHRFSVPQDQKMHVSIFLSSGVYPKVNVLSEEVRKAQAESWKMEPALPHKKFPLEFYPHYYWDNPVNPSDVALKRASLDHMWGIRDTKYKSIWNGRPFRAACTIPPADAANPDSRVESDFAVFGDSKCRGSVSASKNGKGLSVMIDVRRDGVAEINHIYDAVAEQLQSFILE